MIGLGYWGYQVGSTLLLKILLAILTPLFVFGFWGLVDFHQAGSLAEPLRLLQELAVCGLTAVALYTVGRHTLGWAMVLLAVVYHAQDQDAMGQNIFNLALRFILEIVALLALGYWGWAQHQGVLRYALAVSLPLIAAVLWATFRVAGEPNSGPPIVAVPGPVRLLLEIVFFGFAVWSLFSAGITGGAWLFGAILLFHYLISYDRIGWLFRN